MVTVNLLFLATAVFSLSFLFGLVFAFWLDRGKDPDVEQSEEHGQDEQPDNNDVIVTITTVTRIGPDDNLPFIQNWERESHAPNATATDGGERLYNSLNAAFEDFMNRPRKQEPISYDGLAERLIEQTNAQWRERHA